MSWAHGSTDSAAQLDLPPSIGMETAQPAVASKASPRRSVCQGGGPHDASDPPEAHGISLCALHQEGHLGSRSPRSCSPSADAATCCSCRTLPGGLPGSGGRRREVDESEAQHAPVCRAGGGTKGQPGCCNRVAGSSSMPCAQRNTRACSSTLDVSGHMSHEYRMRLGKQLEHPALACIAGALPPSQHRLSHEPKRAAAGAQDGGRAHQVACRTKEQWLRLC